MPSATRAHYETQTATIEIVPDDRILSWDNARLFAPEHDMTRVAATPTRMRRPERRAAIIDGAAAAFARGGYAATSMADIAAATGVSHLIVYRHFDSKEALYEAVLDRALDLLAAALSDERAVGSSRPDPRHVARRRACRSRGVRGPVAARDPRTRLRPLRRPGPRPAARRHRRPRSRRTSRPSTCAGRPGPPTAYVVEAVLVWVEDGDPRYDARFVAATNAALKAGVRSWAKSS